MALFQEFCQRTSHLSAFSGPAPLVSCLTPQLLPPLISERLPPQSDKQHHHLVPIGGAGVSDMVRGGVAGVDSPIAVAGGGWLPKGQQGTYSQLATARVHEYPMGFGGTGL